MRRFIGLAVALVLALAGPALAQVNFPTPNANINANGVVPMCLNGSAQYVGCSTTNPLPISGAITASSAAVGLTGAAVPTSADFVGISIGGNLTGVTGFSLGTQRVPGIAIVDGSGAQVTTFGGAATTSNAASSIATSGNNQAAVVWNYGYNGATWDQLQVDANKYLKVAPQASELHVGEVGGNILPITNAMTTSNATVTTGQAIGGLQTLAGMTRVSGSLGAGGTSGYIQSVVVTFTDAVAGTQADIFFFDANPTGSTCTNAAAFVLADADRGKVIGVAQAVTLIPGNAAATLQYIGPPLPYGLASATSAYACVVARASFAITSTANATLKVITLRN